MLRTNARSPSITSQESYAAVMITDLVADVPVSAESEDGTKFAKEETNLAYDGHMDGETKSPSSEDNDVLKAKYTGISKGVLLNAMQFGQNDTKTKIDEKQFSTSLPVPTLIQPISEPKGFKDMSFKRKIAFIFSFLPSVLFVLCFAVILPCNVPRPCVEEAWITRLNHTDVTSRLELSDHILFTAIMQGNDVLMSLKKDDGEAMQINLPTRSAYLKCGKIMHESKTDCIVMDNSGNIYIFNNSQSALISGAVSDMLSTPPVILTGCNHKMDDIAISVSNTSMKILYDGNKILDFTVSHCDSVPVKLTAWSTNGYSDIVFVCDKDGEDRLVKIPRDCATSKYDQEKSLLLKIGELDSMKNSTIQAIEDNGLVLWSRNEVFMIQPNIIYNATGTHLWHVSNLSHPEENRFILYGNFRGKNKQLALISSNLTSGLKVTLLDPSNGKIMHSVTFENMEATEVMYIKGKEKGFVLLLLRKAAMDTVTTALAQITDISNTIISIISNEEVNSETPNPTTEELALLDLNGQTLDTVKEIRDIKDSSDKSTMTGTSDKKTGILTVYLLTTSSNSHMKTTEVRQINVANWDKQTKSKCLAK